MKPDQIFNKVILISPLDWGMGHTTRCFPIISQLLNQKNQIIFAGNEFQIDFVKRDFPNLEFLFLAGYQMSFNSERSTYFQMLSQILKMKAAIKKEKHWLNNLINKRKIDVVISDNRYGFYHTKTINILITHQTELQIPAFQKLINRKLEKWINSFDCCWVPDEPNQLLSGKLSNGITHKPKYFIGILSRFQKREFATVYDLAILLSGPEPQREQFKTKLENHFRNSNLRIAAIGWTGTNQKISYFKNPSTLQLETILNQSAKVLSRAGYTTLMELYKLQKKSVLIPTPGQFEQEYLANSLKIDFIEFENEKRFFEKRERLV